MHTQGMIQTLNKQIKQVILTKVKFYYMVRFGKLKKSWLCTHMIKTQQK